MLKLIYKAFAIGGARSIGAVLGITFTLTIAWTLGAGNHSDALFAAFLVPIGLWQLTPTIICQLAVPYLMRTEDDAQKNEFLRAISGIILVAGFGIMLLYLVAPEIVLICTAGGLNPEAKEKALYFLRVLAPIFPATLICGLLQADLNSRHIFLPVEVSILLWKAVPVMGIMSVAWLGGLPAEGAVWGLTAAASIRLLYMTSKAPTEMRAILFRPLFKPFNSFPPQAKGLMASEAILVGSDWTVMTVIRYLGSMLPFGGLSIYNYGDKFASTFPIQLIKGIGTVLLPDLAKDQITKGDNAMFQKVLLICTATGGILSLVIFLAAPIMADFFLLPGNMTLDQKNQLVLTIRWFAPSILAMMVIMVCQLKLFLAYKKATFIIGNAIQLATVLSMWAAIGLDSSASLASYVTLSMYMKMVFFLISAARNKSTKATMAT